MLLGLDCANLLYAIQEARGKPSEPIARLTPLRRTYIWNTGPTSHEICHTNFAYTYFVKSQAGIEQINSTLKQFWEIESDQSPHDAPIVRIEEQLPMKKVESMLSYENQMYRAGILWESDARSLQDNMIRTHKEMAENVPRRCTDMYVTNALSSTSRRVTSQKFKSRSSQCQGCTFTMFSSTTRQINYQGENRL